MIELDGSGGEWGSREVGRKLLTGKNPVDLFWKLACR